MLRTFATLSMIFATTALHAQTIHVRVLDGKTAKPVPGLYLQVRNDDHNVPMTLTSEGLDVDASKLTELEVNGLGTKPHGKIQYYVCDVHMFTPRVEKIIANGVSSDNNCGEARQAAKPGELIIFVHRLNWVDKASRGISPP